MRFIYYISTILIAVLLVPIVFHFTGILMNQVLVYYLPIGALIISIIGHSGFLIYTLRTKKDIQSYFIGLNTIILFVGTYIVLYFTAYVDDNFLLNHSFEGNHVSKLLAGNMISDFLNYINIENINYHNFPSVNGKIPFFVANQMISYGTILRLLLELAGYVVGTLVMYFVTINSKIKSN